MKWFFFERQTSPVAKSNNFKDITSKTEKDKKTNTTVNFQEMEQQLLRNEEEYHTSHKYTHIRQNLTLGASLSAWIIAHEVQNAYALLEKSPPNLMETKACNSMTRLAKLLVSELQNFVCRLQGLPGGCRASLQLRLIRAWTCWVSSMEVEDAIRVYIRGVGTFWTLNASLLVAKAFLGSFIFSSQPADHQIECLKSAFRKLFVFFHRN